MRRRPSNAASSRPGRMPVTERKSVRRIFQSQEGQATAEYALVIIAAAAVALALIVWATNSSALPSLFEAAVRRVRQFMP